MSYQGINKARARGGICSAQDIRKLQFLTDLQKIVVRGKTKQEDEKKNRWHTLAQTNAT